MTTRTPAAAGRTIRVGFETGNIWPRQGGVFTYSVQLLKALAALDDAPGLTFIDALRTRDSQQFWSTVPWLACDESAALRSAGFVRARRVASPKFPVRSLESLPDAIRAGATAWNRMTDSRLTQMALHNGLVGRWALGGLAEHGVQVGHWSDVIFPNVRVPAHVVTLHDMLAFTHPEWMTERQVEHHRSHLRFAAAHATRFIAVSEFTRRQAASILHISSDRIDVIHHGVDHHRFHPRVTANDDAILSSFGLNRNGYVLYVGNSGPHKNVDGLLHAFATARSMLPENIRMVLAGTENSGRHSLDKSVVSLGHVSDVALAALYRGAALFTLVSLHEGFGLPVLEAMACGTPVLAASAASLPEIAGDAALLTDPLDVREVASAIVRVVIDEPTRHEMRNRGFSHAQSFTWRETARRTMETYRRALAMGTPSDHVRRR